MYKPIIQVKGSGTYTYKNCFIGYAIDVPISFETDLSEQEFIDLLDGKYTEEQIRQKENDLSLKQIAM